MASWEREQKKELIKEELDLITKILKEVEKI